MTNEIINQDILNKKTEPKAEFSVLTTENEVRSVLDYIKYLPDKERVAYEIAKEHLGTSFTIEKTVGFLKWQQERIHYTETKT